MSNQKYIGAIMALIEKLEEFEDLTQLKFPHNVYAQDIVDAINVLKWLQYRNAGLTELHKQFLDTNYLTAFLKPPPEGLNLQNILSYRNQLLS